MHLSMKMHLACTCSVGQHCQSSIRFPRAAFAVHLRGSCCQSWYAAAYIELEAFVSAGEWQAWGSCLAGCIDCWQLTDDTWCILSCRWRRPVCLVLLLCQPCSPGAALHMPSRPHVLAACSALLGMWPRQSVAVGWWRGVLQLLGLPAVEISGCSVGGSGTCPAGWQHGVHGPVVCGKHVHGVSSCTSTTMTWEWKVTAGQSNCQREAATNRSIAMVCNRTTER